jgi:hypothetical protein
MEYQFRCFALPLNWKTEITDYNPPESFVDEARGTPHPYTFGDIAPRFARHHR